MAGMKFETCCCCIELRTGCLIIGYLNLIGSILMSVLGILFLVGSGVAVAHADQIAADSENKITSQQITTVAVVIAVIVLIVTLLFLTFSIVFLVGIHQNKRGHVKAYMVYCVIFLILYAIMFFASFANSPIRAADVASKLFTLVLNIYFLLVIRSYYFKMNDTSRQPAIYNTA